METLELIVKIVFWLLLLDAVVYNLIAWLGRAWYYEHFHSLSRYLPVTRAWGAAYMALVLWIGYLTFWY